MMVRDPQEMLRGCVGVSSLPMIFLRLNEAINSPRSSAVEISEIIAEDPGLTARLLRLVNSPLYNFPAKIETISRAVVIVGTQQIRDLALATTVLKLFEGIPADLVTMESFWAHSVACGLASRILAAYRRELNVERYFVAGILHDIGRLIICSQAPELARQALAACSDHGGLLHEAEARILGFDHAAVGRLLARAWKLPTSLEEVVGYHHCPDRAKRFPVETAVVHLGDIAAHALQLGGSGQRYVPPLNALAWKTLEIPASALGPALEQVERQFHLVHETMLPDRKTCAN
jgi:HD-like signal output (HDOD) protein